MCEMSREVNAVVISVKQKRVEAGRAQWTVSAGCHLFPCYYFKSSEKYLIIENLKKGIIFVWLYASISSLPIPPHPSPPRELEGHLTFSSQSYKCPTVDYWGGSFSRQQNLQVLPGEWGGDISGLHHCLDGFLIISDQQTEQDHGSNIKSFFITQYAPHTSPTSGILTMPHIYTCIYADSFISSTKRVIS